MDYVKRPILGREGDSLNPIAIKLKDQDNDYVDLTDYTGYISVNNCSNVVIKEYFNLRKVNNNGVDAFVWEFPLKLDIPAGKYQWFLKTSHPSEGIITALYGDFIVEQKKVFQA